AHTTSLSLPLSLHDALPIFVAVQQPLDDLDLEDGVGQRLRGPVVDLAGETAPLRLLRLDDAHLGIGRRRRAARVGDEAGVLAREDRKSTRLNSSHVSISYAV